MRYSFGLHSITALLLCLCINVVAGNGPHILEDTRIAYRIDRHADVFLDSLGTSSIEDVLTPGFQQRFKTSDGLTFGYTNSTIWLRVKTKKLSADKQWFLEIPAPYLEFVDFYQIQSDGSLKHSVAGYYRKQSERDVSHTGHVVQLSFDGNGENTIYVRVSGDGPKTFPLYVLEMDKFHEKVRTEDLGYGLFYGILIVMFFYNLLLYISLKQINYLLYILTIICTGVIFASASGYAGKFIWPENPHLNFYAGRMSMGALTMVLAIFSIRFLEVKKYAAGMYYVLLSLIPLSVVTNILVATDLVPSAGNTLISISIILLLSTGIVCRLKGNKMATYFIAAWSIYLIGGMLLTLRNMGVLEFNFWTTHFVEIGGAMETVIIAFALGDQYRRFKKEKEDAQALALDVQREATEQLEVKVMVRTEQLSKAYEELAATLEKNKIQTEIIRNKNAELDTFFHRISHDLRGPISSLLGLSFLAKVDIKDEQALQYIEKQRQQVERLNQIIVGLINLTKLSNDGLSKVRIDFSNMIDACINSFESLPNFANVRFTIRIQPNLEFYSEWTLLNAIMQNLIENAIKYSTGDSPYVEIRVREEEEFVVLEVEDNGQGIPVNHQSKIFEMFFRATNNASGSGLGLYILKRSVDRLKGTIELKSQVNKGSTFTVKLPRLAEEVEENGRSLH
jgi:signal transduction histidine kinase